MQGGVLGTVRSRMSDHTGILPSRNVQSSRGISGINTKN